MRRTPGNVGIITKDAIDATREHLAKLLTDEYYEHIARKGQTDRVRVRQQCEEGKLVEFGVANVFRHFNGSVPDLTIYPFGQKTFNRPDLTCDWGTISVKQLNSRDGRQSFVVERADPEQCDFYVAAHLNRERFQLCAEVRLFARPRELVYGEMAIESHRRLKRAVYLDEQKEKYVWATKW